MKFSIIIPVYNVEDYILDCLESINSQDFTDYEVIIINDGSSDQSENKIIQYIADKPRFVCYSKINEGVSQARNDGVDKAVGDYILFIDSDDTFINNSLTGLSNYLQNNPVEVCVLKWLDYFPNKKQTLSRYEPHKYFDQFEYQSGRELLFQMFEKKSDWELFPWSQCYQREFYLHNNLTFTKGIIFEDMIFNWQALLLAKTVGYYKKPIIQYLRKREDQITRAISLKSVKDRIYVSQYWVNNYISYGFNTREKYLFLSRISYLYFSAITLVGALNPDEQEEVFELLEGPKELLDYAPNAFRQSIYSLVKRLGFRKVSKLIGKKIIPFYKL